MIQKDWLDRLTHKLLHTQGLDGLPSGGGGVTDHGALTGLADDDHPQYATDTDLANHVAAADPHTGYATDTDLSTHVAAADPHTGYLKETDVSGLGTPALTLSTTNAAGTGTTVVGTGATIAIFDLTSPSTQAFGDAAAVGSATVAARRDHKHAMPANPVSLATPAIALGSAAAAGAASTLIRSDATIAAFDATAPVTQAFSDAAAVGAAAFAARRDHKHGMPADPVPAHAAASDPHTGYQLRSEKGAASGYAGLDAGTKVPTAQLGSGTANSTSYLRGDQTWQAISTGSGETDPIVWMGGI